MKCFHIGDVLSVTTGRLVSPRHIDGIYDILNHLTGDNLYTHQLGRAMEECRPWLRAQFPMLMEDSPGMAEHLAEMARRLDAVADKEKLRVAVQWAEELGAVADKEKLRVAVQWAEELGAVADKEKLRVAVQWAEELGASLGLPQMLPVYEMGADMHTHIDPIEEARAMVGDDKVIAIQVEGD